MSQPTRRDFLATSSLALACATFGPHSLGAQRLPANIGRSSRTANELFPESMASVDLRTLASAAVDAAKRAGASYADIRVAEVHQFQLSYNGVDGQTYLQSRFSYGVRVMVDGALAFVHGTIPSIDAVTTSVTNAVATARGYGRLTHRRVELVPAPVATGEWETPIRIDPFTVPLDEQAALLGALAAAVARVRYSEIGHHRIHWLRETRVFASSEGALTTQTLRSSRPEMIVLGDRGFGNGGIGRVSLRPPHARAITGGYETLTDPLVQQAVTQTTEEAVQLAGIPRRTLDVGRYPVVLDGKILGEVLGRTLGQALELDRVLGDEADASGTSFLSPYSEMLGTVVASPLLTVTGDRAAPSVMAAKWDDEGVEPQSSTVIHNGRLMNYLSSRQTAVALTSWAARQGVPLRSQGCAVASEAGHPVLVRVPHLTVTPAETASTTLEALWKDMRHGVVVRDACHFNTDEKLASGTLQTYPFRGIVLEIVRGKIVRRLESNLFGFNTEMFWKSLQTLGSASTVRHNTFEVSKAMPWRRALQSVTAPAGLFKEINVYTYPSHL
jgi:TldD protein